MMNSCLLCNRPLHQSLRISWLLKWQPLPKMVVCDTCMQQFAPIDVQRRCMGCGRFQQVSQRYCGDCLDWQRRSRLKFKNDALYEYNEAMKTFMHRYKFMGDYQLRNVFREAFSTRARAAGRLVIPIPVTPMTMQQRGFNQTTGLLNFNVASLLTTREQTKKIAQSKRNRNQRRALTQPFQIHLAQQHLVLGRDILVVDDVYTTGTTIRFAAELLMAAGANSVHGLTLAR